MARLSSSTSQYRDGLFSAASPAPRYGQLLTAFEDGSLGEYPGNLDVDSSMVLNKALDLLQESLQPAGLETLALPPSALQAAADARALAQMARGEEDVRKKMVLAAAASYSAQYYGLPRNTVAYTLDQVFGMYAMSASQRRAIHQQAALALDLFVATRKGAAMSGVYKDGVLGNVMFQPGSFQDGSLGRIVRQNGAIQDGSLGAMMYQPGAFRDGALGRARARRMRALRGLSGGCGCSGVGDDAAVATVEAPWKKPLMVGAAVAGLGVVLYLLKKK